MIHIEQREAVLVQCLHSKTSTPQSLTTCQRPCPLEFNFLQSQNISTSYLPTCKPANNLGSIPIQWPASDTRIRAPPLTRSHHDQRRAYTSFLSFLSSIVMVSRHTLRHHNATSASRSPLDISTVTMSLYSCPSLSSHASCLPSPSR